MKKTHHKHHKRKAALLLAITAFICFSGACRSQSPAEDAPAAADIPEIESSGEAVNPFQQDDQMSQFLGGIGHGPIMSDLAENNNRLPWLYDGQDVQIAYYVNAFGQAKSVGFLVFVDGIPQPYTYRVGEAAATIFDPAPGIPRPNMADSQPNTVDNVNTPSVYTPSVNTSNKYMHIFELEEDNVDWPFTFIFSPVTGKQGETLDITVASFYNPNFRPDMENSVSYGGYHQILATAFPLAFSADAAAHNYDHELNDAIQSMTATKEPVTNQLMETITNNALREIDDDTFNSEIFNLIYYDGSLSMESRKVSDNSAFNVKYILCGHGGLEYTTSFYVNHQPIAGAEGISVNSIIEKGAASVIELEIDISKLADFNTFYAISVPKNAGDFPDGIFETLKSPSLLLYK